MIRQDRTVTNTLDDLEQVLQSVSIPTVHVIAKQADDNPLQQIPLTVAESRFQSPIKIEDTEEINFLSMPLIVNDDDSHISDTPPKASEIEEEPHTGSQIAASSVAVQSTVSVKPHYAVSRGKDIENLRQQYTSPGLLNSSSEVELSVSHTR